MIEWQTGLCGELFAQRADLAIAQRVEQAPREDDTPALPFSETLADQVLGPLLKRLLHLAAETALRQRDRLAGNRLPVEPSCAGGVHL